MAINSLKETLNLDNKDSSKSDIERYVFSINKFSNKLENPKIKKFLSEERNLFKKFANWALGEERVKEISTKLGMKSEIGGEKVIKSAQSLIEPHRPMRP